MTTAVISDSSSLIMVGKLKRLDLLANLFQQIVIPHRVATEIQAKEDGVASLILAHPLVSIAATTRHELLALLDGTLGHGEAEAIALADEHQMILLVDEKKARKAAKNMGLKIIGLLGVLLLNHRRTHITGQDAILMLEQVKAMGFRVSARLESDFMTRLHNPITHWHSPNTLK
ncbi:hypothetical protein VSS37_12315 [Candidatus Thiothrix sp. Deng01]|uniref:DUF3368 domain-containing protein n=1 Tax=Candidatus Thiothrix phosphatis TaxID=3112415 RepID=A0ABU6D0B9_9GAMM|nr:hypothetical protein [Candidatus Thiothrix sp. Deng01]MEB4591768.1 hypothetical protein [Candidatus Thiothrix sp. Deng01]